MRRGGIGIRILRVTAVSGNDCAHASPCSLFVHRDDGHVGGELRSLTVAVERRNLHAFRLARLYHRKDNTLTFRTFCHFQQTIVDELGILGRVRYGDHPHFVVNNHGSITMPDKNVSRSGLCFIVWVEDDSFKLMFREYYYLVRL